ncbi:MAG TPA: hypothetical protein VND65_01425 [Candidatus Binatia bacterium]|nr:hypothetical protein [Candidatus Binatia bacterium]
MSLRVRNCVECPRCHTFYLVAFSPYANGSYLVRSGAGIGEEYILYCFCARRAVTSRWRWPEIRACAVSDAAHEKGYGTIHEIWPKAGRSRSTYLNSALFKQGEM